MKRLIGIILILVLFVGGYAYYFDRLAPASDFVVVYFVRMTDTNFLLVPVIRTLDAKASPEIAITELLAGPTSDESELYHSVPSRTELLDLTIRDRTAYVDFSHEIVNNFNGGSSIEACLVNAIVNTLIQFKTIDHVQILVAGEIIESIGGHVYILEPLL